MDPCHRRRQRFGQRRVRIRDLPRIELREELEDARATLGGLIEVDMKVGDALDPQALAELVPDERHGVAERRHGRISFGWLADDADPDLGVPEVRRRLDIGDRDEPDPRIRQVPRDDLADLLPEKLIDSFGSLTHDLNLLCRPRGRSGEGATEHNRERTSRCVSEGAEGATHAGAFMRVAA